MKDKKFQVFVSSTYDDLKEERQAAVEAILSSGNIPAGMELFSAGDESQMVVIKRWIDESDIYLLIFGGRYGSIEAVSGKSYTHLEFEYAIEKNMPIFAVVIKDDALENKVKANGTFVIELENQKLLQEFKNVVLKNLVRFWEDIKDIKLAIHETISDFTYDKKMIGWIKGDNSVNSAFLAEEIARLTKENSDLRDKLNINNSKNQPLYNNLTFNELKKLLTQKKVNDGGYNYDLFSYLLYKGQVIANREIVHHETYENFKILSLYKLVKLTIQNTLKGGQFEFTEEGHNFYLKALIRENKALDISKLK